MKRSLFKIDGKYLEVDFSSGEIKISEDISKDGMYKAPEFGVIDALIGMTLKCNLACGYCFARGGEAGDTLTKNQVRHFIDFLSEVGAPGLRLYFSGGEPTTTPGTLADGIRYAKSRLLKPQIFVVTNGVISDDLLEKLIDEDVVFRVSFEGLPEIHDSERPFNQSGGSSKEVLKTIRRIVDWNPSKLIVRFNVSGLKVGKEVEIATFLRELGVKVVELGWMARRGRGIRYQGIISEDEKVFMRFGVALEDAGLFSLNSRLSLSTAPTCGAGIVRLGVSSDGFLIACDGFMSVKMSDKAESAQRFVFGKVNDGGVQIDWDKLKSIQDLFTTVPEKCLKCGILPYCRRCYRDDLVGGKEPIEVDPEACRRHKAMVLALFKHIHGRYFKGAKKVEVCEF